MNLHTRGIKKNQKDMNGFTSQWRDQFRESRYLNLRSSTASISSRMAFTWGSVICSCWLLQLLMWSCWLWCGPRTAMERCRWDQWTIIYSASPALLLVTWLRLIFQNRTRGQWPGAVPAMSRRFWVWTMRCLRSQRSSCQTGKPWAVNCARRWRIRWWKSRPRWTTATEIRPVMRQWLHPCISACRFCRTKQNSLTQRWMRDFFRWMCRLTAIVFFGLCVVYALVSTCWRTSARRSHESMCGKLEQKLGWRHSFGSIMFNIYKYISKYINLIQFILLLAQK